MKTCAPGMDRKHSRGGSIWGQPCDTDPTSYSREYFERDLCCCDALWALGIAQIGTMGKGPE
jgi:hypothetical protein